MPNQTITLDDMQDTRTTLQDGIIYFEKPVIVDFIDFSYAHLGCDAIAFRDENKLIGQVKLVAYASDKQHNNLLRKIFLEKYGKKDYCIETGLSEAQADGIF